MYKQLEKWIEMAIEDGELTKEQKDYLTMKADSYGIDSGEFNYVLQSRLAEKRKSLHKDEIPVSATAKSDKIGDIRKCPSCGSKVETVATKCPVCGQNIEI